MNVLFLGNGFDLFHNLPTKYINFLNTVHFLSKQDISTFSTIGDVFSNQELNSRDKEIHESYNAYDRIFDRTPLDEASLNKLKRLSNNLWYKYFSNSFKSDFSWIDFEKEILSVIEAFQDLFKLEIDNCVILTQLNPSSRYIIRSFDFFLNLNNSSALSGGALQIKEEYLVAKPFGSKNKVIDKNKIVGVLSKELIDFTEGLKSYLNCFVEKILDDVFHAKTLPWEKAFKYTDCVISFNYTSTYEKLYKKGEIYHIHGNVNNKIILGINPDNSDTIETIDTTFIHFKKYFQRIKYKTDFEYLDFVADNKKFMRNLALYVIGHSLDSTDKDVIEEVFDIASSIYILSYDEIDESNHISNLINIFGKERFDEMRRRKNITFISIHDDISVAMRRNSPEAWKESMHTLTVQT